MKKIILLASLTFALIFPALPVHAQVKQACDESTQDSTFCKTTTDDPISGQDGVILNVVRILSFVVGAASVFMVLLGALKYITAGGDPNSINSAKNTVLYAIIGAAIFTMSQIIIRFVLSKL